LDAPGRALFDLDKLYRRLDSGKSTSECPEADCDSELEINSILHGLDLVPSASHTRMAEVVERAVSNAFDVEGRRLLDAQTERVLAAQDTATGRLLARVEALDDATKAAFSRAEQRLNVLVRGLQDEGADGPRLFTMEPLSRTVTKPGITTQRTRLTLWCEHSRLPVHVLEPARKNAGVYVVDVPRDWWVKAAPLIRATSILLKTVLPVSLAAIELDLSDDQWNAVNEQLALEKEVLEVVASQGEDASTSVVIKDGSATPTLAEGGLLRLLHSTLRQQDITFADLRRVTDYTGQYLWVHRQFVGVYQPQAPVIPQ
jgi:hypothetical protein